MHQTQARITWVVYHQLRQTRRLNIPQFRRGFAESLNKVIFTSTCQSTGREGMVKAVGDSGSGLDLKLEKHVGHGGKVNGKSAVRPLVCLFNLSLS